MSNHHIVGNESRPAGKGGGFGKALTLMSMGFKPQCARRAGGIEPKLLPPRRFVAVTMNFAMVSPAQRDRELVADFTAERPVLGKAQVMGVAGLSSADQTGLL